MALQDLLNEELTTVAPRIVVQQVFDYIAGEALPNNSGTAFSAPKTLVDFYDMVRRALDDYQTRAGTPTVNKVIFTEEEPDKKSETESIVFNLMDRVPGQFAQGAPMSRNHVNHRPIFRQKYVDPVNPGYNCIVNGYYYDNIIRFTAWARTNKAANSRASWFEDFMEDYSWWFKLQGLDRVLFWGRNKDIVTVVNDNPWYGRPIDYFVRTEKLRTFHEKTLEEILINLSVNHE